MPVKRTLCLLVFGVIFSLRVAAAATLTGVVVDAVRSTPIAGASVTVAVLIPDSIAFRTSSDSSGSYQLSGIPGGNAIYVITCYVYGYADFYMRYDALALGDRQVDIMMYPQAVVPPGGGQDSSEVSGVVLYETAEGARNPVAQATVTLKATGIQSSSNTGVDGLYTMRLPRASYALIVEAPNYETLTAGGIAVDSAGLTLNVLLKATVLSDPLHTDALPGSFALENAYPNPFNPTTVIRYQLPVASRVRLAVTDMLGREVRVLVDQAQSPGRFEARFDASGLSSGMYLCRLTANGFVETRKLLLLR